MIMADLSREEIRQQLQQIDPYEFEELVAELWESQGYETTVRKGSGDRGIDVEAIKEKPFEQKVLIQVKRYTEGNKVGSEQVRNYATLYQQVPDADTVVIVTTSGYTTEAERLARDLNIKTIDIFSIVDIIMENKERFQNHFISSQPNNDTENKRNKNEGVNIDIGDIFASEQIKDKFIENEDGSIPLPETTSGKLEAIISGLELVYEERERGNVDLHINVGEESDSHFSSDYHIMGEFENVNNQVDFSFRIVDQRSEHVDFWEDYGELEQLENHISCNIIQLETPTGQDKATIRLIGDNFLRELLFAFTFIITRILGYEINEIVDIGYYVL